MTESVMFSKGFVSGLIYGSVGLTAAGVVLLICLLLRDYRTGRLW